MHGLTATSTRGNPVLPAAQAKRNAIVTRLHNNANNEMERQRQKLRAAVFKTPPRAQRLKPHLTSRMGQL
jgi:hypothetical protein